jgi:hypothetical protein
MAMGAVLITVFAASTPSEAQGFLDFLFGPSKPSAPANATPSPFIKSPGTPIIMPPMSRPRDDDDDDGRTGTYRTLCVRTCDGYYFPISQGVSRRQFGRDNAACRAQCGDDARLFFHRVTYSTNPNEDIAEMTDLNGRAYGRLPFAFKYRKGLVAGCQCRPEPWSDAEARRHHNYAIAEGKAAPGSSPRTSAPALEAVAGRYAEPRPPAPAPADPDEGDHVAAAPDPVVTPQPVMRPPVMDDEPVATKRRPEREPRRVVRAAPVRPVAPVAQQNPQPAAGWGGSWGLGAPSSKMVWPGDAPVSRPR